MIAGRGFGRYGAASVADLKTLLNPEQYEAATTTDGPLLVLAGAGSGKTRVLVHRIAHIMDQGLARPWEILAVTFTNKAAQEMRHRLVELGGEDLKSAWIGTFHSMCGRMLRREGHRLGYDKNFTIYDTDDARRAIKAAMQSLKMDTSNRGAVSPNAIASEIDKAKNKGLGPKTFADQSPTFHTPAHAAARRVYPKYQELLRTSNAMDFGDLLLLAVELLKHHPEARDRFGDRFQYVLVDEFQDTNAVQLEFLKRLVEGHRNIAVVGDDDQSIYRWRGAEVRNIIDFPKLYSEAKVVKLEQNYRSSANVLQAANAVIARNQSRHPKKLWTKAEPGLPVGIAMLEDSDAEAILVAEVVARRIENGDDPDGFAILYRSNAQSRLFELAFRRARVPFVLIGSTAFFERREVKDVISYLRTIANPASSADFERIVNVPGRKIGAKTIDKLREAGERAGVSGAQILELDDEAMKAAGVKGMALAALRRLGEILTELRAMAEVEPATDVAQAVIERTGYKRYLETNDPASAEDRIQNVEELVTSIAEHEATAVGEDEEGFGLAGARTPLQAFLDEAALTSASDKTSESGAVSMLTLHAAKGLEFGVVFMVGMEEHTFPSRRAIDGDPEAIEEERRLCYVGMTRAQKELNMLAVRYRRIYGSEEMRRPSRFLGDIPPAVVENMHVPGAVSSRVSTPRTVVRGADYVDYDSSPDPFADPPVDPPSPFEDDGPRHRPRPAAGGAGGVAMQSGMRVFHNTFGEGVVEAVDGSGPRAHLTIRFPEAGRKRVVARYVRPSES